MDRKQFEEWFKTTDAYKLLEEMNYFKIDLFIFKEHRSQYQHTTVQIAYMTWQHQQAKVEELQTHAQEIHKREIKLFEKTLILTHERDELQKRVDVALKKLDKRRDELWSKWKEQADMQDQGAANAFEEAYWILEQALKGEG